MKIDGACHCGEITFEAETDPKSAGICHCTDCQTMSGTAFRTVVTATPGTLRLASGEPKTYVKTAESGNRRTMAFCATCGTQLWACNAGNDPSRINVRAGTLRQRTELAPRRQIWFRSAQPWLAGIATLPSIEKQA